MAYSELIKNFEKIRGYMREFYIYGFKSREEYTRRSARSYDDERRRIESWLGDYMSFRRTAEGKNVFLSVDNRSVTFNPLHSAWKAKSFTDNDIVLHFAILDLLADGAARSTAEIADGVTELLEEGGAYCELDESTIRNKLKEYAKLGVLRAEKRGRALAYRLAEDGVELSSWAEAVAFFSEQAPLGVIGSYLLDRLDRKPTHFRYKHHYLLHTLDAQILYGLLCAMKEKRSAEIVNFSVCRGQETVHRAYPLRIHISTRTGREYLLAYHYGFRRLMFFRLDAIRAVRPGAPEERAQELERRADAFEETLWGVSAGSEQELDHVELTLHVEEREGYILDRLLREKRRGRVERIDEQTCRFTAEVCDAMEMLPWIRTFIGRILRFESSNRFAVERFYADLRQMAALYGEGGEAE
jgi:DNA-binding transcriptional ArsR family regulator